MLGKIDHQQLTVRSQHACGLDDRRARLLRIMEHLVQDDAICAAVAERERVHVALAETRTGNTGFIQFNSGKAKHFG